MKRTVALLTCMALMIPGAAVSSANSTGSGYGHPAVKKVTASRNTSPSSSSNTPTPTPTSATETSQTGSLPFTGLDVGGLAAGAVLLLGAGLVLRRVSVTDRS